MTLTLSIVGLLTALVPLIVIWVKRGAEKATDPKEQIQEAKDENREAIANRTAGNLLMQRLNRLSGSKDQSAGPDDRSGSGK